MPLLKLSKVQVMPGGYGAVKKQEEATSDDIIDMAPDLDSVETAEAPKELSF
jgi:hypothetical protein